MANQLPKFLQFLNPFSKVTDIDVLKKNLAGTIAPVQLQRLRQDVLSWREAITEAENAWYPQRVKMQRLYIDTKLNAHVLACIDRRKDLTMLRRFELVDTDGNVSDDSMMILCDDVERNGVKSLTPKKWLNDFISYSLDALFYGYTLIALGDITDDGFVKITPIKRWNISPDRLNVTTLTYSISGAPFLDEPYKDWHVWIDTPNDIGASTCGYGLLYNIALYEIFLRNLLGFNGDFIEMFAQPYRVGKTMKTSESERAELETTLRDMGSAGYAIIDPTDEITFLETALGGTGYKSYDNLEKRCEQKISKLVLGHADALDSVPGKLGAGTGNDNPVHEALEDKQTKDGLFIENIVNKELLPRLRVLGFNMPDSVRFSYKNDAEQQEIRKKEDANNLVTANIAQTMKAAGLQMDAKYFQDRTGVTATIAPLPIAKPTFNTDIKNKLERLYR